MSNLTAASREASASLRTQPVKKKRSLPGNPDPDAEVIALSPKFLLATNRFICEICNKGFQRDQNLQLHRRGHNLPWKLKQRTSKEIRKKVYVCPEPTCVHHDPSRALGDLTGIKKHFCRKHGEKKWKCDKCSKRYAVQSDWKAHSNTCGTRDYRCDCGTLFSRRDSFITHRAFCDALAEESARAIITNPFLPPQTSGFSVAHMNTNHVQQTQFNPQKLHAFSLKKESQIFNLLRPEIPPWLAFPGVPHTTVVSSSSSSIISTRSDHHQHQFTLYNENSNSNSIPMSNPNPSSGPTLPVQQHTAPSPHMSATALLQIAAQMGATMSKPGSSSSGMVRPLTESHVSVDIADNNTSTSVSSFGLKLSSREAQNQMAIGFAHSLAPFGNQAGALPSAKHSKHCCFLSAIGVSLAKTSYLGKSSTAAHEVGAKNGGHGNDSLTMDYLGLKPLSHSDIFNIGGLGNCMGESYVEHQQSPQSQKQ